MMNLVLGIFANTIPVFLYLTGKIPSEYFFYFIIAEILFWIGFIIGRRKKPAIRSRSFIGNEKGIAFFLFLFLFFLYVSFTLITYIKQGIPAFMSSRLDVYTDSGGLGILGRFTPFFSTYCIFYSYYIFDTQKSFTLKILAGIVICTAIIFGILSGSRASVLSLVFILFGYFYFFKGKILSNKTISKLMIIAIIGALVVFSFTSSGGLPGTINSLLVRIASTGDGYWMSYANDRINQVDITPWYKYFFSGILGPLRIVSYAEVKPAIGAQLSWLITPELKGIMVGPNARPPILGYIMFGWGGLLFSFIIGWFTSSTMSTIFRNVPKGIIGASFAYYAYFNMLAFIGDPTLGVTYLFDIILNAVFILSIITLLSCLIKRELSYQQ
jgi:oligosaccharide repeat unit polymerase